MMETQSFTLRFCKKNMSYKEHQIQSIQSNNEQTVVQAKGDCDQHERFARQHVTQTWQQLDIRLLIE